MKTKVFSILFITALATIFYGCPYQSEIPVDSPKEDIMGKMLGKWAQPSEKEKETPTYYDVTKFDNYRYKIVEHSYSSSDSAYSEKVYVAHTTTIDNFVFLNMQELGQEKYDIYKVDITDTEFTMFEVTDNIDETFTESKDFIKFIKKNMYLSFFYNAGEKTYVRY